jgi:hypothetical protein
VQTIGCARTSASGRGSTIDHPSTATSSNKHHKVLAVYGSPLPPNHRYLTTRSCSTCKFSSIRIIWSRVHSADRDTLGYQIGYSSNVNMLLFYPTQLHNWKSGMECFQRIFHITTNLDNLIIIIIYIKQMLDIGILICKHKLKLRMTSIIIWYFLNEVLLHKHKLMLFRWVLFANKLFIIPSPAEANNTSINLLFQVWSFELIVVFKKSSCCYIKLIHWWV